MDTLGRMAGVNVYLDPQGLNAEGVTSDTPVTLNLTQPISLKSALNLVLSPLGLSYVIQNEVLRITSEQTRDSNTYAKVYYVADLVMPIPNFVPNYKPRPAGRDSRELQRDDRHGHHAAVAGGVLPLTMAKNEGQQQATQTQRRGAGAGQQFWRRGRHSAAWAGLDNARQGGRSVARRPGRRRSARFRQPDRADHAARSRRKAGTKSAARARSRALRTT